MILLFETGNTSDYWSSAGSSASPSTSRAGSSAGGASGGSYFSSTGGGRSTGSGLATKSIFSTLSIFSDCLCFLLIISLPGGQINEPSSGRILFSSVPPSNSLVSVSDPQRAFWADTEPFKGHIPRTFALLPEGDYQVYRTCRRRRTTPSRTTDANLDVYCLKHTYTDPWLWKENRIQLS